MRQLPVGAEIDPRGGVNFRVWAPRINRVDVVIEDQTTQLDRSCGQYYSGTVPWARHGMRYYFRLDGGGQYPDPASRFQPDGPHGASQIVDPSLFAWTDQSWKGCALTGQIIYEIHIGTFTREGGWEKAMEQLPAVAATAITLIEVMPVADFPGRFGWGYDGVNWFAPTRLYGSPDDFRAFVNRAHALGLGVILDVVYNHFGPDGNYIGEYSTDYFTNKRRTDWGEALNFDGPNSGPVREYVLANVRHWIAEYHLDGLRLDATQNIYDTSSEHILAAIARTVRETAGERASIVVGENEPQDTQLTRPVDYGGFGMDALWNDDLHHSAHVALTGHNDAYYTDYLGSPQELVSAAKYGYLYQGQWYKWQRKRRGTPALDLPPARFINFLDNHDQIANSGRGLRCHQQTAPGLFRALTAYLLLIPGTPMLFQGQEFGASAPFLFFADHKDELGKLVLSGRRKFMAQWRSLRLPEMQCVMPDPADGETFNRSKVDHSEREKNPEIYSLHCDLLRLRREDSVFRTQKPRNVDGAVLGQDAFVLRFFGEQGDDRLLAVNLGRDLHCNPAPEPLLAPPLGSLWRVILSTEDPKYGGCGTPPPDTEENWRLPGQSAIALAPYFCGRSGGKP